MRIATSTVAMSVEHQSSVQRAIVSAQGDIVEPAALRAAVLSGSDNSPVQERAKWPDFSIHNEQVQSVAQWMQAGAALDARMRLNKLVLEGFLGRQLSMAQAGDVSAAQHSPDILPAGVEGEGVETTASTQATFWAEFEASTFLLKLEEKERTEVSISAVLSTLDGRRINVDIKQQMSRHLHIERDAKESDIARFMDPLVVNFSGPVRLNTQRVGFDLDGDGQQEHIARFASDSAYLALDKNGDGRISDGGELFGVASGNGFEDLRAYDLDGNGYIDAADPVYSELSLYRPGFEGSDSIRRAGIEALSLAYIDSPFALKSSSGEDLAQLRSTGFYLTATGAGSLQQIDLAV